ncbi:2-keto-3-deoxy-L-rhamnonate aldolase [bioreactor metagenome]|uniref:2-keto-3-deoxy-L-rhamnonate aldolase n=1 Tax=bioreactor metagenome TaxID=1076179 RepID=A0A644TM97_9ZZZZ|nr:aldolase/citrate lyase family protein [Negativicutes bacterium]
MTHKYGFKEIIASRAAIGTFLFSGEADNVEVLGYAGFDFVIICTEHASNGVHNLTGLLRAADVSGIMPIVRVTENNAALITKVLDAGAGGVLIPHVITADQAKSAVKAAKYGPQGERGLAGIVRAARYGFTPLKEYTMAQNKDSLVIVQIEDVPALENIDEILAVEGVDGIFVGPADLSQSMGIPGQFDNPEFQKVVKDIIRRGREAGKIAGIFVPTVEGAKQWQKEEANFLAIAADTVFFAQAARSTVAAMKD